MNSFPGVNGLGVAMDVAAFADPTGAKIVVHSLDSTKATYRYSASAVTPHSTPHIFLYIQGSASKTVRIKRIALSGKATASGSIPYQVTRASALTDGANPVVCPAAKHDVGDAAATAVVKHQANDPTGVTLVPVQAATLTGGLASGRLQLSDGTAALVTNVDRRDEDFSTRSDKALVLRGIADFICVSFNGATLPTGTVIDYTIETEEDNS